MSLSTLNWRFRSAAAGVLALGIALAVSFTATGEVLEQQVQALIIRWRGQRPWNPDVVLATFDDRSRVAVQVPVSRRITAGVFEALHRAGARVIASDVMASNASFDGPEPQAALEAATLRTQVIWPVECLDNPDHSQPPELLREKLRPRGIPEGPMRPLPCRGAMLPYGRLVELGPLAQVRLSESRSGYYRTAPMLASYGGEVRLPSLGLAAFLRLRGVEPSQVVTEPDALRLPDGTRVHAPDGERLVFVRRPPASHLVSLVDLLPGEGGALAPEIAARVFGKTVFYGFTSRVFGDWHATSSGEDAPLVALHASVLSDLLEGRSPREAPRALTAALALLLGAAVIAAVLALKPAKATLALAVALAAVWALSGEALRRDLLMAPAAPTLSALAAFVAASLVRLVSRERERSVLRDAFAAYVDPHVLRRLMDDPARYLALGGARRRVSILFSDVVGYTQLTNRLQPEQAVALLREYLEAMTNLVKAHGGRIDKIMGDGVMAVFGDPLPAADHAARAVEAGARMQQEVERLRAMFLQRYGVPLAIRIGIATGEVFVGNIGAAGAKLEYTVLGPAVNLASRLEGKAAAGTVVVSAETAAECDGAFRFKPLPGLSLKGFEGSYDAFVLEPRTPA